MHYAFSIGLEGKGPVEADGVFPGVGVGVEAGGNVHREVWADVEVSQLCIHVGIDDGYQIHTYHADDAKVAVSPVEVFACLQH